MKKVENKKCQEVKKDALKKLTKKASQEIDMPRLTSDYLEQTLQII